MQFQVNIRIALPEATGDGWQKLVGGGEDESDFDAAKAPPCDIHDMGQRAVGLRQDPMGLS